MRLCALDWANPPPRPVPRFSIRRADDKVVAVSTPGNLTCVAAKSKTGKSAWLSAWVSAAIVATDAANAAKAAAVAGADAGRFTLSATDTDDETPPHYVLPDGTDVDTLGVIAAANTAGHALLYIDSEQSQYDAFALMRRALDRAGVATPPPWLASYCVTHLTHAEINESLPLVLEELAKRHGGIFAVLIDGAADLVADVNDATETAALVSTLHRYAIIHDCPVVTIVHRNEGDNASISARGWLGSQLTRKTESNVVLDSADGITSVFGEKMRHLPIYKSQAIAFCWDDEKHMHISCKSAEEEKAKTKATERRRELQDLAEQVFKESGSKLTFLELVRFIMDLTLKSESSAKRLVQAMSDAGIIHKVMALWQLVKN
jgi:hypothetical protein